VLILRVYYPRFVSSWQRMWFGVFYSVSPETAAHDLAVVLLSTLPVLLVPLLAVVLATLVLSGVRLYPKKMVPKLDGLNPAQNIKRIFSLQSLEQWV